jgi:peptidoglycan/xylan/chitin deacetylase (PgdA/CDA1 family)
MAAGGMVMGSHTHTHQILSKLPEEEQYNEAARSKRILEEKLGTRVDAMAYPVGLESSFSAATEAALKSAGYRAAFSYYGGINLPDRIEPFNIRRCGVGVCHPARFRMQTMMAVTTGKYWP